MKKGTKKKARNAKTEMSRARIIAQPVQTLEGYQNILRDVRGILDRAARLAYKAVNHARITAYWEVGWRMVRGELENKGRANYGARLVANMAKDLGISRYELARMMDFYRTYPIVATVPQQLSWSHIRELLPLVEEKRKFYELKAVDEKWSVIELRRSIRRNLYEQFKKDHRAIPVKKLPSLPASEGIFKERYHFDFLDLNRDFSERELEDALCERAIQVLTELGKHFSLVGRQVKILIDGNWESIDLVFFHTRIHCYILVELKKEKFKKDFVGQMNGYIEYYRHHEETEKDNPTIGLILCKNIGYEEAVYALGGLEKKIFVAKYQVNLPTKKELTAELKSLDGDSAE
ncbi:MAG: PDDEXK nuclease domain-containing protein [Desulfobacterales bacterium]|nr:PDDEXK nuclease domain-containing protein [Desulfobacterales bacterium]